MEQFIQAVSTLGFPIVCCAALFWKMMKDSDLHREEVRELQEAINNNTIAITKLLEHLDGGKSE